MDTVNMERFETLNAEQIAKMLNISRSSAYMIIRNLNKELKEQGKITLRGKISRVYLESKLY